MSPGAQSIDSFTGAVPPRALAVSWIHGSPSAKHNNDPDIQVHAHDEHTVILQQNKTINYEAPFLFLLFGETRAVLIDTGATAKPDSFPLRRVVDELISTWLALHPREGYGLLVVHTHAHRDHVAADGQFADRPETEMIIGAQRSAAWDFFGFGESLEHVGLVDLGGRVLECLPTPGHHESCATFYDPWTGFLFTGDTIYRGRLYIQDWAAFARSIDRLIEFCDRRPVTHVLGCHIEMTRQPRVDYPVRTTHQPDEPPLEMTVNHLYRIRPAIDEIDEKVAQRAFDEFIIVPNED